jgi:type IV pilus assembly protein PilC
MPRADSPTPLTTMADKSAPFFMRRMPLRAMENFCHRMAIGLRSGVSITKILEAEGRQGSPRHREVGKDMLQRVMSGETLAEAMGNQGGYFPPLLAQLIHAGESGGGLDRIFQFMSEYYRDLRTARSQFVARITWPAIQFVIALLVVSGLILLQGLLQTNATDKPYDALGMGLRGWSGFVTFWAFAILVLGILGTIAFGIWKNWLNCHQTLIPLVRNVPILGPVFTNSALSRLSMTLTMLLNAGVDAKRSVRDAFKSTGNFYYMSGMKVAADQVEQGQSLAHSFEQSGVFPREFIEAIEIGELSGTETDSLERLAAEYQRRFQAALVQLSIALSTLTWLVISGVIIFFIFRIAMQYINLLNNPFGD